MKFEAYLPHCVRNVKENNVLLFKFRCNIFIDVRIIKEMLGSVSSGTPCIMWRVRFACWITKATHTHTHTHTNTYTNTHKHIHTPHTLNNVIITAVLASNGYVNAPRRYVTRTLPLLLLKVWSDFDKIRSRCPQKRTQRLWVSWGWALEGSGLLVLQSSMKFGLHVGVFRETVLYLGCTKYPAKVRLWRHGVHHMQYSFQFGSADWYQYDSRA
jgi:hypothetical protein